MVDTGRSILTKFADRHRYLLTLIVERGLFFLLGIGKLIIVITRLVPEGYVEYVSLLGLATFIATMSKLGVEIYIKLEIPQRIGTLPPSELFHVLITLMLLPSITVLLFSSLTGVVSKHLGLYSNLTTIQISLVTILLAINGL